ncbi:hypothetical protein SAMN06893096_104451 [Geodermatophilus pulveris]|uniref:Uncharacterized protein n=1 Tax=Geodermatophilus pulveris TaxID=1564159 RepID=A0A239F3R3_9ACTN|nr:hypothetical protein [Geodermatophilus pulveris]SNS51475.1 hypothetical protein SAMN06893096_104451 [Geodermatophilus pulveris]
MTVTEDPAAAGRALLEAGAAVAGTMSRSAAAVVYPGPAPAAVQLPDRLARCLRAAADEAAQVGVPRERARAGAVLAFAVEHGVALARGGRPVRDDGFFAARAGGRSAADTVAEAVVSAARGSHEERRVRHLGYLLAEVAWSPDLDAAVVERALALATGLTWRQLVLLAGVGRRDRAPLPMTPLADDPRGWAAWGAREDVADLQQTGLLDPPPARPRPGGAALPRLRPADLRLTRRGVLVHRLLALGFVRDDDVAAALADLGPPRT